MRILILLISFLILLSCEQEVALNFESSIQEKALIPVDSIKPILFFGADHMIYIVQEGNIYPTGRPYRFDDQFIHVGSIHEKAINKWEYNIINQASVAIKNNMYSIND